MRILTEIDGQALAQKFVAFLLTLKIDTHVERVGPDQDVWEIWVRDEDHLQTAKSELAAFLNNPGESKYEAAIEQAEKIIADRAKARALAAKQIQSTQTQSRTLSRSGPIPPLTLTLLIICIVVGLFTNFGQPRRSQLGQQIMDTLGFVSAADYVQSGEDPAASLKRGQVWRVMTPIVVHLDPIHLAINLFVFVSLGRLVERWLGTPRYALLILALAIVPNVLQGLSPEWMQGSPFFGGISGVVYGLFGYVWVRGSINPSHGVTIPFPMVMILSGLIVIGLLDIVPNWNMADLCHLGGLLVGAGFGFASEQN